MAIGLPKQLKQLPKKREQLPKKRENDGTQNHPKCLGNMC